MAREHRPRTAHVLEEQTFQDSSVNLHFLTGSQISLHTLSFLARVPSPIQRLPVLSLTNNLEMTEHLQQLWKGYTNTVTFYTRLEHSQTWVSKGILELITCG